MSPWALESSYRYARASAILLANHLMGESEVNAALSMELLFKSLLVVPVMNKRHGTCAQQYILPRILGIKDGHDLYALYQAIPQSIADALCLPSQEGLILRKRHVFKQARYCYEETAPTGRDDLLLGTVSWLLPQTVRLFLDSGVDDKWVLYMGEHPEKMHRANLANPAI